MILTTQPTIHRAELPVDDRWHILDIPGPVVSWGCRQPAAVEFWFWANRGGGARQLVVRVYGTGHPVTGAEHTEHRATLIVPETPLVWHVIEWMGRPGAGAWPPPSAGVLDGRLT